MSHNIRADKFYSTLKAWHDIANFIRPERYTATEVHDMVGFSRYEKIPLFYQAPANAPDGLFGLPVAGGSYDTYPGQMAIYRHPAPNLPGKVVGIVSESYEMVTPLDLATQWDANVFESDGVTPRHIETMGLIGRRGTDTDTIFLSSYWGTQADPFGDDVNLWLMVEGDLTGAGSVQILPTTIKPVCANTHAAALSSAKAKYAIRHDAGAVERLGKWLRTISKMTLQAFESMMDSYARMAVYQLTDSEIDSVLLAAFEEKPLPLYDPMVPVDLAAEKMDAILSANAVNESKRDFTRELFNGGFTGYQPKMAGSAYALFSAAQEVAARSHMRGVEAAYYSTITGGRGDSIRSAYGAIMALVDRKN